ncbi:hypothetical protein CCR95_19495 [Thiocystis minor]|uniref:hypothetical protein n=1 Tax=Thiocystis minor TaxID=61597 RepID=UPI0019118124|nr:hypothetical protein [Thiocystis minor]MBK5966207.1 hypothetical protein [Thiocystis minor]
MNFFHASAALVLAASFSMPAYSQSYVDNPQHGSFQSGVSVLSGWHCDANIIETQIDDGRLIPVAYGGERADTESICGDWNNGFVAQLNFSGLGDGWHHIHVYADGVLFGYREFLVTTYGEAFLSGHQKSVTVTDFPNSGDSAVLTWDEAKQAFTLSSVQLTSSAGTVGEQLGTASDAIDNAEALIFDSEAYQSFLRPIKSYNGLL